ncbi:F-box protein At3g07870-like [Corylus avellana]|uniref:F-box protein At3g07870-like n=1 Tax=Corylus avellana TaxID=13451 RepID=UPI00286B85BC|nr:F-box protein At3g07870-like [Corylus avellana]
MAVGGQFPTDILFDIFSRLPIKSLLRFRRVSPLWCSIIDDPCLAQMHQLRRAEEPKVLLVDLPAHEPDVMLREDGAFLRFAADSKACNILEGCCNGLLCFTKKVRKFQISPLFLFNPARQEVVEVPPPCMEDDRGQCRRKYGLGFDCSTNTYKIVAVFEGFDLCGAQVYTLGGGPWRAINKGPPCGLFGFGKPIYARGGLHWDIVDGDIEGKKIVYFDVHEEEFGFISRPKLSSCDHLVELRGELAIVDLSSNENIEIWVMKVYEEKKKKEWVKEYKIGVKGVHDNAQVRVIGLCEDGEILVKGDFHENYFFYNPKTDNLRYTHVPRLDHRTHVLCHMGTLLSIAMFRAD